MILRLEQIIPQHLSRLRLLQRQMLLVHHLLHQTAMQQFPRRPPLLAMSHQENMVTRRYQICHVRFRTVGVECAFLVDELFDEAAVGDHDCCAGA